MFFSKASPAPQVIQGGSVHINEGGKTPEQRYERARTRVDNLKNKLRRLQDGRHKNKPKEVIAVAVANTEAAIEEWTKRMMVAQFEIKVMKGEA